MMNNNIFALLKRCIIRLCTQIQPRIVLLNIPRQINHLHEINNEIDALNGDYIEARKQQNNLNCMRRYVDDRCCVGCNITFTINAEKNS